MLIALGIYLVITLIIFIALVLAMMDENLSGSSEFKSLFEMFTVHTLMFSALMGLSIMWPIIVPAIVIINHYDFI